MRTPESTSTNPETAPQIREGKRYLEVTFCYGCQSCIRFDEDENVVRSEHIIDSKDVTELVQELVKTSKELATIVVANKLVMDDIMKGMKEPGNG